VLIAKAQLSERVEAKGWDRGWARVYEMLPLEPLDDSFLERVAARLAGFITTLQPLVADAMG